MSWVVYINFFSYLLNKMSTTLPALFPAVLVDDKELNSAFMEGSLSPKIIRENAAAT